MFVGGFHTSGVHFLHIVVVDQHSQLRLHSATPTFGEESCVIFVLIQFLVHRIIQWLVNAVVQLFKLRHFSATFLSKWIVFAVFLAASVDFFV